MKEKEENKTEVKIYLAEAREKKSDNFDILNWWKVNSSKYPVLALVARDVLVVPISTVTFESAFNTGECVLDSYKSSLSPEIVEALVCAQNWFQKTPLPNDMVTPDEAEGINKELAQVSKELGNLEI